MRKPSQAASDFYKNLEQTRLLLGELSQQLEGWRAFNRVAVTHLANAGRWEGEAAQRLEDTPAFEHGLAVDKK